MDLHGHLVNKSKKKQTPSAVLRLRTLTEGPEPKVVRVGIRTKGCSGQQYDLSYTSKKEKFDEEIKQDGMVFFFVYSWEGTLFFLFCILRSHVLSV